ncbi:hypothetical protein HPB52_007880 [Rhipicephalus sanguineus]|uniref:Uncharacterized protein n=1 Tax=Rhipicephalus sanguineus TaxID=34632 RepID=A0A9D4PF02_RHISA|nr:hypothetical protein HPB52_007880 [Rhipicephalus sanguineus]
MWPHWLRSVAASQEPTAEDKGDDKGTHSLLSSSVALFSRSTPECVSGRPSHGDDLVEDSAPRERKTLLLKPRSVTVGKNKEAAAVPEDLSLHLRPRGSILEERDPFTRLPESLRSKHG